MAFKQFDIDGIGPVTVYKRRSNRSMRLSVARDGEIRVSIPLWAPYRSALSFVSAKQAWITANQRPRRATLENGQGIGKSHRLILVPDESVARTSTHIRGTEVRVRYPAHMETQNPLVQNAAATASLRALKLQAKNLLTIRLRELATRYDYEYKSLAIKQLTGRWGSCDQHKNIVLNLFLMQVPWHLIDYVIMHELAHTHVMRHGQPFWEEMEQHVPNARLLRKQLHEYQPVLSLKP